MPARSIRTSTAARMIVGQNRLLRGFEITAEPAERPADVPVYLSDTARVRTATGWMPRRDAATTLDDITRWLRDNERTLRPILS